MTRKLSVSLEESTSVTAAATGHQYNPVAHEVTAVKTGVKAGLHHAGAGMFYVVAALGEFMSGFGLLSVASVQARAQHYHVTSRYIGWRTSHAVRTWHSRPWSRDKALAPVVGSLAWLNLVFGESIALVGQGLVERGNATGVASFLTHMVIAVAIEFGFTYPIAARNDRQRKLANAPVSSVADVVHAAATAFWLGGAMGVDEKKLGRKHMAIPIASYMLFAVLLATVGNYHDLAARIIETPEFFIALIIAGLVKKVNELTEYQGMFERLAARNVQLAERFTRRKN